MRVFMSALRIGIAVAVINAAARTGLVYWSYYQFEDAAQQLAVFGRDTNTEVLRSSAYEKAAELLIPIAEDQIVVTRDGPLTHIQASYEHPVEYFPNKTYPLKLSFSVEGRNLTSSQAGR
jgi:hypothetical protein